LFESRQELRCDNRRFSFQHPGPSGRHALVRRPLELETKSSRGREIVHEQVAVRQSVVDLRVHDAGVGVELPIDVDRNRVQGAGACRRRVVVAERSASKAVSQGRCLVPWILA
jgi:hypothetical protein